MRLHNGKCELLPPLDASFFNSKGVRGYGLVTAADLDTDAGSQLLADGYSTLFQMLLIGFADKNGRLYLVKFASTVAESHRWRGYDCRQRTGVPLWGPNVCSNAAIVRGNAQWLFDGTNPDNPSLYTLDVSVNTGHISATMLPFDALPHASPPVSCLVVHH